MSRPPALTEARLALGAQPRIVLALVWRTRLGAHAFGVIAGIGGARAAGRALGALLYDVSPTDGLAFAFGVGVMAVVAQLACLIPARRAMRVDPMTALRHE